MSDTISRRQAIEALQQMQKEISGDFTDLDAMVMAGTAYIGDCIGELQDLPSAESDIIACGDCKYYIPHDKRCGYWNHGVKPLDWCCHAERRNDE